MSRKPQIRGQHGQTMTEFALVMPILLFLLLAIIQFGVVFNNYVTLTDAVRAGARKGAVARRLSSPSAVTEAQVRSAATDLKSADLAVTVTSTFVQGSDVTVEATYPYELKILGLVVKSGRLHSKMTERVE
jgi:Flp pilus assembly protein TadG